MEITGVAMRVAGITFTLIMAYLILTNPAADKTLLDSGAGAYIGGVKALQGR